MSARTQRTLSRAFTYFVLGLVTLFIVFPLLWMALTSIKSEIQLFSIPPIVMPEPATLDNYRKVISDGSLARYFGNSLFASLLSVAISMLLSIPAAYGLSRMQFRGSNLVSGLIMFMRMVPGITFCFPYFMLIRNINLTNTRWALIIMYVPIQLIMSIWLMRNFFMDLPSDLEDAADIDGASLLRKICSVVVPISLPSVSTAALFAFLASWNEYILASTLLRSPELWTMPIGISSYTTAFRVFWGELMTNAVLYTIPVIAFTVFAQKGLISGLTVGAVKS